MQLSECPECGTPLQANQETACVYLFTQEAELNHVDVRCECGKMWTILVANQANLLRLVNDHGVPFQGCAICPPKVKHDLMQIMENRDLRDSEVEELGVFHDWLDEINPDDFEEEE